MNDVSLRRTRQPLRIEYIMRGFLGTLYLYSDMSETLPRSTVVVALIFAFGILCLFSVLFVILCRRAPRTTAKSILYDAESSNTTMGDRASGRPASIYKWHERQLGHELRQNSVESNSKHPRLPPLFSRRESLEAVEAITPTESQPVIFGDEDKTCVQMTVTPPTPAKAESLIATYGD
ncbi:hypothetical protein AX15_004950 [Amanita polypyramis BW_CC]|nr:hypothetical protein AX15_004950 [Amanita polypyramis BW_CC]